MRCASLGLLGAGVLAFAGCGGGSNLDVSELRSDLTAAERDAVTAAARTYTSLYLNELDHGTATAVDLRRLRTVTTPRLFRDLARRHRYVSQKRRTSAYARRKLEARPTCVVERIRVILRRTSRVLAEPKTKCGTSRSVVMFGFELIRDRRGRWVVGSTRDARFADGRCVAKSCRSPSAPYE